MAITTAEVSADCGEIYDAVDGGTTAVNSMISRAESFVKMQSGTTTGYDEVIRPLVDSMVTNQVIGGIDSVNKTIGALSVGQKDMRVMYDNFWQEARKAAIIKGFSLDGFRILMKDSEQ